MLFHLQLNCLWFSYPLSLLHSHHLVKTWNYELCNIIQLPITSSLLGSNFLITLLLNALNRCSLLNTRNQVANTNEQKSNCPLQNLIIMFSYKKAALLQVCSGPEGSRKLRFPDFMTTAQGCGKVISLTHRPHLPLGNSPGTHFC